MSTTTSNVPTSKPMNITQSSTRKATPLSNGLSSSRLRISTNRIPISRSRITQRSSDKIWGREIWITNTALYCGKHLLLNKGYQCSLHYHKIKDETFHL